MASLPLFERGRLTDWLLNTLLRPPLTTLVPTAVLVGDSEAPAEGGWSGGQPGQGTFVPYVTLGTGRADPFGKQTVGPAQPGDWLVHYTLRSVGALREQCDWVADQSRKVWNAQQAIRLPVGDGPAWKAYEFTLSSMGPVTRNDSVNPPYWEVVDDAVLSLSRCRT